MGRKLGKFGESPVIHQTKPSELVVTINNPLADLFICQTFSAKHLKRVNLPNILPAKRYNSSLYN